MTQFNRRGLLKAGAAGTVFSIVGKADANQHPSPRPHLDLCPRPGYERWHGLLRHLHHAARVDEPFPGAVRGKPDGAPEGLQGRPGVGQLFDER